jgi:hypothetical protein
MQQGFIKGRSMVENILKVDLAAKRTLKHRTTDIPSCGAIVLFDFRAAFPSVDQDFLIRALQKFGFNKNWISFIKKLYIRNNQKIGNPEDTEGFMADTGIRQGCPLSPILFAIVADLLLRKLQQEFPDSTIKAFADDTAMVIDDMRLLPRIIKIFKEYAGFSNLGLNLKKKIIIPLTHGKHRIGVVRDEVLKTITDDHCHEQVEKMLFTKAAKYLGVVIGPEAGKQAWDEPLQKYITPGKRWAQLNIGLNWSIKMYNVSVFSVLSFMAQFYEPTLEVLKEKDAALKRLMPGPRKWITKNQLMTLSAWGGYIRDPSSIQNGRSGSQAQAGCLGTLLSRRHNDKGDQ